MTAYWDGKPFMSSQAENQSFAALGALVETKKKQNRRLTYHAAACARPTLHESDAPTVSKMVEWDTCQLLRDLGEQDHAVDVSLVLRNYQVASGDHRLRSTA